MVDYNSVDTEIVLFRKGRLNFISQEQKYDFIYGHTKYMTKEHWMNLKGENYGKE